MGMFELCLNRPAKPWSNDRGITQEARNYISLSSVRLPPIFHFFLCVCLSMSFIINEDSDIPLWVIGRLFPGNWPEFFTLWCTLAASWPGLALKDEERKKRCEKGGEMRPSQVKSRQQVLKCFIEQVIEEALPHIYRHWTTAPESPTVTYQCEPAYPGQCCLFTHKQRSQCPSGCVSIQVTPQNASALPLTGRKVRGILIRVVTCLLCVVLCPTYVFHP